MSLRVSNDWALRSWLLGFGAAVRVVVPPALADALVAECQATVDAYAR